MSTTYRGYDLFAREREAAEVVEPYGVKVLRREGVVTNKPSVMIFRPKAVKPEVNFSFRTPEAREAYIARYLSSYAAGEQAKASYRAERKVVAATAEKVSVGTIFVYSWGYDQTNVDYFEVIKVSASGKTVTVAAIGSEEVPGSQGQMSARVTPRPGAFLTGRQAKEMRKTVQYLPSGEAYLSFEYGWCRVVRDGESNYSSWYA